MQSLGLFQVLMAGVWHRMWMPNRIGVSQGEAKSGMTQRQDVRVVKRCYIHFISLVNACLTHGLGLFQGSATPSTFRSYFRQTQADPHGMGLWDWQPCTQND